jgi:GH25 family lysozyme M1 (1,4-beta-N-acetylmuramidase)/uncharacterized protein YraI
MANLIGPDVSFYQDDPETPQGIDFAAMHKQAAFVIIRAGQNLWPDPDFKYNWREAKKAGLARGSYWFYDSRANPKRQAELWVERLEGDLGELPLFADLEETFGGQYSGWGKWYDFLERLRSLIGEKEIAIYTAYYYWRDHAPNATTQSNSLEYFHQYPLWIAHYKAEKPRVPKPWADDEWLFWQFTEQGSGKSYGVESIAVDLNYFNGELESFHKRFPLVPAGPPPSPAPTPGPGTKHRVIAASLRIREGPGTTFSILGGLRLNDIVEEITANTDRTWIKIKREDGLIGWVASAYLLIEQIPTPPPAPPPPSPTGRKYRASTRLKVCEGPGTSYDTLAVLETGEVVEEVGATADRTWLNVKRNDGLIGWSSSAYLIQADSPPLPPAPSPLPLEADWYKVIASSLIVRDGPGTSRSALGYLLKDDIVPALAVSSDGDWLQIRRVDGLVGWSYKNYLSPLGRTTPELLRQALFTGTTYFRKELQQPRRNVVHVLTIDLSLGVYHFVVTPPDTQRGILCTRTVSEFLEQFGVQIAINGNGYSYLSPSAQVDACPEGDSVIPNGYAASRGRIYSERGGPTVYINRNSVISFNEPRGEIYNAVSGDRMVLIKGKMVENLATNMPNARTAIGLSSSGGMLILMVVDGRQPGYSEGVDFPELAELLTSFGAYTGINMDGGGSSTMVIKGMDGKPRILNIPVDQNIPGKQCAVANHLGIIIRK